jgi:hypothetical protein
MDEYRRHPDAIEILAIVHGRCDLLDVEPGQVCTSSGLTLVEAVGRFNEARYPRILFDAPAALTEGVRHGKRASINVAYG